MSALLLQSLIKSNIVNPKTQVIGMIAMAGISHGPIFSIRDNFVVKYIEKQEARELFEFCNPNSKISKDYYQAMEFILNNQVRVVAIASWFDQVVPVVWC